MKTSFITLTAYFPASAKEEMEGRIWQWIQEHSPETEIAWKLEAQKDWLKEWKKFFKPFRLAGLKFVPVWLANRVKKDPNAILVEPGMAFGTGTHATTRFAIELLKFLKDENQIQGKSVLDVGTGSGILSVVAQRFGAQQVLAIDNDPECWRESAKMFKKNNTKNCRVSKISLEKTTRKFDVIIANIIDGVLIDIKDHLWRSTKPNGYIILSGILTDGAPAFKKSFMAENKGSVIHEMTDQEWTALLISK